MPSSGRSSIVGLATVMALPFGILIAIYVNEFAPERSRTSSASTLDVLAGVPAIVIGIFVFGLIVVAHGQSGYAGAFALAVLMLPLVARSTIEVLALVPNSLREAALGVGAPRWRTTLGIVLPQTIGGILTGATLAVARVAGETAPLLFTCSLVAARDALEPVACLCRPFPSRSSSSPTRPIRPTTRSPGPAAFVLIMFILVVSLGSALARHS